MPATSPGTRQGGGPSFVGPIVGVLAFGLLLLMMSVVAFFGGGGPVNAAACGGGSDSSGTDPSGKAVNGIPENYLKLYKDTGEKYGIPWQILAALGKVESEHGVNMGPSSAGALGPMQFLPSTWKTQGVDGDGDGDKDIMDPKDAIPGAANKLINDGVSTSLHNAILAYNRAEWYVELVITAAQNYGWTGNVDDGIKTAKQPGGKGGGSAGPSTGAPTESDCSEAGSEQVGKLGVGDPDPLSLIKNPRITLSPSQVGDLKANRISPKIVALLSAITKLHKITVTALSSDHAPGTNHEPGRGVDIAVVDGEVCNAPASGREGKCWQLAQELDAIEGKCYDVTELIYYFDPGPSPGSFARSDHNDHVHVGYDGPTGSTLTYAPGTDPCSPEAISGTG